MTVFLLQNLYRLELQESTVQAQPIDSSGDMMLLHPAGDPDRKITQHPVEHSIIIRRPEEGRHSIIIQDPEEHSRIIRRPEEDLAHIIIRHLEDGRRRMIRHPGDGHRRIIRGLEEDLHRIIIKDPAEDQMGILHSKNEERDL